MRKFESVTSKPNSILPVRGTGNSAGYDFYSPQSVIIRPYEAVVIPTGIKVKLPHDEYLRLVMRSSIGIKKRLMLTNTEGIIDSDYYNNESNEGEILIPLYNYGDFTQSIQKGERICQGIFTKYYVTDDDKPLKDIRTGGVGSTNE